jgi:4-amino-4-deoxy-L-arabinose transferase-like glycosyltransferase
MNRSSFSAKKLSLAKPLSWFQTVIMESESLKIQFVVALACVIGSISIGLGFAKEWNVVGWQFWSWLACVVVLVIALIPPIKIHWNRTWLIYASLFLAALMLRLPALETIPGGLHTDEVGVAQFVIGQIYQQDGTINPFSVAYASQPTLFHYILRLFLDLFGRSIWALRLSSAFVGAIAVVATFAMVDLISGRKIALFCAIMMVSYHFHVHWSRLALNNIWDTLWVPVMVTGFIYGWKKGWEGGAVISGLALGLSQYFYSGAKIGLFLLIFLTFSLWKQNTTLQSKGVYLGKLALTAICAVAPLLLFAVFNWDAFNNRNMVVWGWKPESIQIVTGLPIDLPRYFWHQLTHSFGAYFIYPDIVGFYLPGIPLLIGIAVPLFIAGFVYAIIKRNWLPVLWILLVTILGGFLLVDNPSSNRFVAAIPAICWLVGISLAWIHESKYRNLAIALLVIIVITDLYFYFGVYVPSPPRDLIYPFPTSP